MKLWRMLGLLAAGGQLIAASSPFAVNVPMEDAVEVQGLFKAMVINFGGPRSVNPIATLGQGGADPVLPVFCINFAQGFPTDSITQTYTGNAYGICQVSIAELSCGATAGGYALLESQEKLAYINGHYNYCTFMANYSPSLQEGWQWVGLFDDKNGVAIGMGQARLHILYRINGIDTLIDHLHFNKDMLNGTGPSGLVIDGTNLTFFKITYGVAENCFIQFSVLSGTGEWVIFHEIVLDDEQAAPLLSTPLPMRALSLNIHSMDELIVGTANWCAGSFTPSPTHRTTHSWYVSADKTVATGQEEHVLTLYNTGSNQKQVHVLSVEGYVLGQQEPCIVRIRLRKDAVVEDPAIKTVDAHSIVSWTAQGEYHQGTGEPLFATTCVAKPVDSFFVDLTAQPFSIALKPYERLTVTAEIISNVQSIGVGLLWQEL
jgi:hypothetical protein